MVFLAVVLISVGFVFGQSSLPTPSPTDSPTPTTSKCVRFIDIFSGEEQNVVILTQKIILASRATFCLGEDAIYKVKLKDLLRERRELLINEIKNNPERALVVNELPLSVISTLSEKERSELIEKRGEFIGSLEVIHEDDFENPENSRFIFYLRISELLHTCG